MRFILNNIKLVLKFLFIISFASVFSCSDKDVKPFIGTKIDIHLSSQSMASNDFVINIVNYAEKDIYDFFLEKISTRGFDEIASCNFDNNTLSGISLFSSEEQKEKTKYVSELLRCEYNEGYNYGTFRVAIERFSLEMKSLNIPYEALYLQSSDYSRSFVWVNNIFTENFSEAINNNWITNKLAENIKEEFIQNAKCIDSKKYDAYSIS